MEVARGTDRDILRGDQYAAPDNLDVCSAIYAYGSRSHSMVDAVAAALPFELAGRCVLDVGCGPGAYSALASGAASYVAIDLSHGMVAAARARYGIATVGVADAECLPFADNSFDVVLAMHMLYHVPDRALAISELACVVRRDGVAVVASNGAAHHRERRDAVARGYREVVGREFTRHTIDENFLLEDAPAALAPHFTTSAISLSDVLAVPEPEPVVRYVTSIRSFIDLADGPWQAFLARCRRTCLGGNRAVRIVSHLNQRWHRGWMAAINATTLQGLKAAAEA